MPEISSHSLQISFTSEGRAGLVSVFNLMRSRINWEVGCWASYGGYLGSINCSEMTNCNSWPAGSRDGNTELYKMD